MHEAPRHLIAAGPVGKTRVLRLVCDGQRIYPLRYVVQIGKAGVCCACGCTNRYGCSGGCWWVDDTHTLCSRCMPSRTIARGR